MCDPWVKVWWDWYTTRSHLGLSFDALHLGPFLMSLAQASQQPGRLLSTAGLPLSTLAMGREARMLGSDAEITQRMDGALAELAAAGTLLRGEDQALGFREEAWRRFQSDAPVKSLKRRVEPRAPEPLLLEVQVVAPEPVMRFPVVGDPGVHWWLLFPAKVAEWRASFPGVDVEAECRRARQWVLDNPRNTKTAGGMARFLGTWLSKAQNAPSGPAKTRFESRPGALLRKAEELEARLALEPGSVPQEIDVTPGAETPRQIRGERWR